MICALRKITGTIINKLSLYWGFAFFAFISSFTPYFLFFLSEAPNIYIMPMYNDNNRKLRTILLVLAILLVLLRLVKTAKAEGIEPYAEDYLDEYIDTYFPSEVVSVYEQNKQYYYSFVTYTIDNNAHVVDILPIPNSGITLYREGYNELNTYSMGVSCYTNSKSYRNAIYTPDNVTNLSLPVYGFRFVAHSSGIGVGRTSVSLSNSFNDWQQFGFNWLVGPQGSNANCFSMLYSFGQYNYISSSPVISDIIGYAPDGSDVYCNFSKVTTFVPSYTDDSRLKFWKFNNLDGSETLVTDLSEFLQGTEGVMDNQITSLVLTYQLDNIEHTLSLDSSNSVIRRSGTATTYRVETPFSAFGFNSSVTAFDITKCDFTLTYTAYGYSTTENYKISCDYPAFRQSSPVEPDLIPSPAVSDPAVDSSVYTFINTVYSSYSSDRYGRSGTWDVSSTEPSDVSVFRSVDVYHFANEEHGSGVDESIYYYSLLDWGNTALDITAYTVFDWDRFLSENTSALYFDVISVPIYHFTPVGQSSTISGRVFDGYAIFYTPSYFLRQQYGLLGNILTVVDQDAQNQYNNGLWLVSKLNDFENKTLDALNASLDIETDSLSWIKTLDNSIKSLDFPDFDDSSILSGLASIVSALSGDDDDLGVNGRLDKLINFFVANDAELNESALTYRNWLDGLDPTETRRVTHFGTNIYSLVKNIFDIFDADYTEDPSFENPDKDYLDIASDYIDALNDRNNTNKFFRGFFDSSFDPLDQSGLPGE